MSVFKLSVSMKDFFFRFIVIAVGRKDGLCGATLLKYDFVGSLEHQQSEP